MVIKGIDLFEVMNRRNQPTNQKRMPKKSKGIKTNLIQVKQYLSRLMIHIRGTFMPTLTIDEYFEELIKRINIPLGPSSKQLL